MVKLSQCMIVKNERANIGRALTWAKDIACEQIVVDTGSTDGTAELAKLMGAKVYHFEWNDDFSAAKNYAISKATGDWIVFLDADEYFNEEDTKKLINYLEELQDSKYLAIMTSLFNLDARGGVISNEVQTRIFRNINGIQYQSAIHEYLTYHGKSIQVVSADARDKFSIFHTGYANDVNKVKNKAQRNIRILLKEIEKDPKNRRLMCYLGDAYFAMDDYEKAREWFQQSVDSLEDFSEKYDNRISSSFLKLMNILYNQRKFQELLQIYEQAVCAIPEEADFDYMISYYWILQKQDYEKGIFHLEQAFQKFEVNKESFYGKTLMAQMQRALEMCAVAYYNLQKWDKCIENCVTILKENAYDFKITSMLSEVFHIDEVKNQTNVRETVQFLSQLYSLQSLKDRIYLLKVAIEIHYDSLLLELLKPCTLKELEVIDASIGQTGKRMTKLSQCMIVKNEEANIEKALSWAKDISYEQIVVDTGSTDRTVEIAEKMGAKVYHFEWIDDFSAAKNYALSKATGDWIAFLDADEYFSEEDAKKLMYYLERLQDTKYMVLHALLLNLDDDGKVSSSIIKPRIFRNIEGLRYRNSIHENLVLNGDVTGITYANLSNNLTIFHTGYTKKVSAEKKKSERNIKLLLKEIEKKPEDRWLMGYLGDAYLAMKDYEKAREWFEKSIASLNEPMKGADTRISLNFSNLMKTLQIEGKMERFFEVYEQAVCVIPKEPDFDYFMGSYFAVNKMDFEKGIFYLENAFQKAEADKENYYGSNFLANLQKAWELRVTCYYQFKDWVKCIENCVALLKTNIYQFSVTTMLMDIFRMDEEKGEANAKAVLQFLSQLYSLQSLKDRMYLVRAATEIHYDSLGLELRNLFTKEELAVIDGSIGK